MNAPLVTYRRDRVGKVHISMPVKGVIARCKGCGLSICGHSDLIFAGLVPPLDNGGAPDTGPDKAVSRDTDHLLDVNRTARAGEYHAHGEPT